MSQDNPKTPPQTDGPQDFHEVQIYGTHLYAVPKQVELSHLKSFPPDGARWICVEPTDSLDAQSRDREAKRALNRFRAHIREDDLADNERYVVAVGRGQSFATTDLPTFRDHFGSEGN
jgi:hypothetical protein